MVDAIKAFMIEWNNTFVLDKAYREKHKIRFNSPEHRETCQIDIYFEWLEDQIFEEHTANVIENNRKKELYNKGIWISEREVSEEDQSKMYDDLNIDSINEQLGL